jgi:hypothetical protein
MTFHDLVVASRDEALLHFDVQLCIIFLLSR